MHVLSWYIILKHYIPWHVFIKQISTFNIYCEYNLFNFTKIIFNISFFLKNWETILKNVLTYGGRCMSQKVTPRNIIIYANIQTY